MKKITILIIMAFSILESMAQPKVIAHRGYWKTENSAQNSLTSLRKAAEAGCYGSEFDVILTADDELVVNHDDKFKGVVIPEATAMVATAIVLSNGEHLPTIDQYFSEALKYPDLRLILEIKPLKTTEREMKAVELTVAKLREYRLLDRTDIISFSLDICKEAIRLLPDTKVYYLNGDLSPQELKNLNFAGADYNGLVLKFHEEWIKECHNLGLEVNVWTIDNKPDMRYFIEQGVDYITTNYPEKLMTTVLTSGQ